MNKDEVLSYLQDYFASIDASEELLPELLALIAESGVKMLCSGLFCCACAYC